MHPLVVGILEVGGLKFLCRHMSIVREAHSGMGLRALFLIEAGKVPCRLQG